MLRILACAALLVALAPVARAETYYVDGANPAATDAGPGTSATPYRTIQAAVIARASAGNTIVVKPATYRETVAIAASGSASSRIVLRGDAPGVIVAGTDDYSSPSRWTPVSGSVYLAPSVTWSPKQVFLNGTRLTASLVEPGALPTGSYCFVLGAGLYVNAGGGNPGGQRCEVGRRTSAIVVSGGYVTIDRLTATQTEDRAIAVVTGGGNSTIQNCAVTFANRYGIEIKNAPGVVVAGNTVSDHGDHGIHVATGSHGARIHDNESFRNARPASRAARGVNVDASTGCTVERNRCHDNQDSGFHYNNGANNGLSRNNLSWNNGDHGFDHVRSTGVQHFNDVAWNNHKDGFSFEGASGGGAVFDCIAANNGLTTGEFDLWVDAISSIGFTADHNIFWNSTSASPIKVGPTIYATVAAYAAVSGQDQHSHQLDPKFVDPASADFRLRAGSPAIDAANAGRVGWPDADYSGIARTDDPSTPNSGSGAPPFADLGAFEYRPTSDPDRAPVVVAPESKAVFEGEQLALTVTASDPDGHAIQTLTADLSGLPPGHNASFTTDAAKTSGTLRWTPSTGTARATPYTVTFTAANVRTGTASTSFQVNTPPPPPAGNLCGNPSFEAGISGWEAYGPTTLQQVAGGSSGAYCLELRSSGTSMFGAGDKPNWVATVPAAGTKYRFNARVRSSSHQGMAKLRLREYLGGAAQGPAAYSTSVTLSPSWQPLLLDYAAITTGSTLALEIVDAPVAGNEVFQIDEVSILVIPNAPTDRAPVLSAPAAVTIAEQQTVVIPVTASDPDGNPITSLTANLSGLPVGHGAMFTPNASNTAGTLTWTPTLRDGAAPYSVTFTAANGLSVAATTTITVTDVSPGPTNLCGNPGFESDLGGWVAYGSSTLSRVAGGHGGSFCAEIRATGSGTIGIEDDPQWVTSVPAPGTRYRFSAWVRSASHQGVARLQVREFIGTTLQGAAVLSPPVTLSPAWQQLTADFTTLRTGSLLVMEVKDFTVASGEILQVDDVSITRVGSETVPNDRLSNTSAKPQPMSVPGFGVTLAGNPVRGSSMLEFALTMPGPVRVQIFDVRGRQVLAPFERAFGSGRHRMPIGRGEASRLVPGAYFYRLSAPEGVRLGRFVVLE